MRSKFWFYFAVKLLAIIVISMVGKRTDHGKLLSIWLCGEFLRGKQKIIRK